MKLGENFGSWTKEEVVQGLQRDLSAPLVDSDAPDDLRFYTNTVKAIRSYATKSGDNINPAIFLLCPEIPESLIGKKEIFSDRRLDVGESELGCRVWFVNLGVQRGKYFKFDGSEINKTIDFLMELGLEEAAAVVYTPRNHDEAITLYSRGLDQDSTNSTSLTPATITHENLKYSIDRLYESSLVTPTQAKAANAKIWSDAGKWHPAENVEKEIQGRLQSHFYSSFSQNLLVLNEVSTGGGRLDMLLVSPDLMPGKMISHALLELKALRSYSYSGATPYSNSEHLGWIKEGTVQASIYKRDHNPLYTALCCFDMCKDELEDEYWFSESKDLAKEFNVLQWRWRLYNSSSAYRDSKMD